MYTYENGHDISNVSGQSLTKFYNTVVSQVSIKLSERCLDDVLLYANQCIDYSIKYNIIILF